ncbi:MAG: glutathione S-transferase N-terminal domain-containing protein [Oleispira antarctica]|nr:glutathione S-transferase N-terminal domain-containing protein [Oleispira antarctica]MBQ0793435.1 glutathione S-transferase N-terminal domain-containing protein [Oleispira antarctica]|tara:strand:- start:2342 stop:2731 length:390 start_codon:yes stop_codon:yes gene_type:complete
MVVVRAILGALILFFNWVFTPKSIKRDAYEQTLIDAQTKKMALYQYAACPFCVKVRRSMKRSALNIETRDAKRSEKFKEELLKGGGQLKVPCLRIEEDNGDVRWMYESGDIINYLEQRFGPTDAETRAA